MGSPIDWNTDITTGYVSIGTHSLFVRAAGPARTANTPAIICIPGAGDSSVTWLAVIRHVSAFGRVYGIDRTGLGNSQLPQDYTKDEKSGANMAKELKKALDVMKVAPPYLLVMHSLGGIPGREFLHLYQDEVAGMVFLDTVTEDSYKTRGDELQTSMMAMWEGVDNSFMWTERKPRTTDEEWAEVNSDEGRNGETSEERKERQKKAVQMEIEMYIPSSDILGEKKQLEGCLLGDRPVSVVKGDAPGEVRKCYENALAAGNGTEKQRKIIGEYLDVAPAKEIMLQFKQLRLSRNSRMVEARESWHNIQLYEPELVARELKWCLEEYLKLDGKWKMK